MRAMGVRRYPRVCALLALGAVLASAAAGCQDDPDDPDKGGIAGEGSPLINGPNGKLPANSSSPGLEPPVVTPAGAGGNAASAGSGSPTTGAPMAGAAANPATPGTMTMGGASGSPDVGASGAGGMAGGMSAAGSTPDPGQDAGMGDSGADDPCAEPGCGVDQPCGDSSLHCIKLELCDHAVCITTEAACQAKCDEPTCALLESYPEQVACN